MGGGRDEFWQVDDELKYPPGRYRNHVKMMFALRSRIRWSFMARILGRRRKMAH